jgi:hypothetical protein
MHSLFIRLQSWDVLIDDLCSPLSLTWHRASESYGSAQYAYKTVAECEDDFYELQYALEISRRDRRKTMDSNANSAGEYSKACFRVIECVHLCLTYSLAMHGCDEEP